MTVGIEKGVGCNFCDKSKLSASGNNLIFPYEFVYTAIRTGRSGMCIRICEDCIEELYYKTKSNLKKS